MVRPPESAFDLRAAIAEAVPGHDPDTLLLLLWTTRLGRTADAFLHDRLRDHGLDTSQQAVLMTLLVRGTPHRDSPTNLARILVQTTGGTTKTLRRLADAGLVRRVPHPSDGRSSAVELTAAGVKLARATIDDLAGAFAGAVASWPATRRAAVTDAIRTMLSALEELTGEVRTGP